MSDAIELQSGGRPNVSQPQPRLGYQTDFWLVFIATSAIGIATNLFVFFPVYVVRLGGDAATIGAIVGVGALAALVARPGFVPLVERHGRRSTALWSLIFEALTIALYIPVHSLGWPIYAVRMLQGAVDGAARVALFALVFDILPEGRRGEGMALFSLSGQGPAALGPPIGEALLKYFGFTVFFWVAAVLCVIAAATISMLPKESSLERRVQVSGIKGGLGYRALISDRNLMPLWVVAFAFSFALASRMSFVAPFAYQKSIGNVGWYFALYSGIAVVLRLFGGSVIDRTGVERIIGPSMGLLGAGIGVLALTGTSGALVLAAVLGGVGHSYAYPALSATIIAHTPRDAVGRSSAVYTSIFDSAAMLAPYVLGIVATLWGYAPMFVIAGLVAIGGALYYVLQL